MHKHVVLFSELSLAVLAFKFLDVKVDLLDVLVTVAELGE